MQKENRHIELTPDIDFTPEIANGKEFSVPEGNKNLNSENNKQKNVRKVKVKDIIDGSILVRENMIKQLPYVLFLTFLGIIYIGNRFHAERMVRKTEELKIEVGNLRSEQITVASELMNISRPSQVSDLIESKGLGLKESLEPPKKLKR